MVVEDIVVGVVKVQLILNGDEWNKRLMKGMFV